MAVKSVYGSEGKRERDLTQQVQGSARIVPLLQCIESEAINPSEYRAELIFPYLRPFKQRTMAFLPLRQAMRDILEVQCSTPHMFLIRFNSFFFSNFLLAGACLAA